MARERFPAEANECGGHITWLVMTSGTTDSEIRDHLDAVLKETGLSPAQLLVFTQNEIPAFDFGGQAFLKSPSQLVTAPDGNGGFYDAICPLLPELETRGVQHLHIYCVDNILCRVADPLMIGCAIDRGADCALKVIEKRDPAERRCPVDPSKLFLNAGSIANHVVTLNFLREACAKADAVLPYHMARKRIPFWDPKLKKTVQPTEPNGIKLERFIFDAFTLSKDVLLWHVPAEEEFSPLEEPREPHAQWIREACIDAQKKEETRNGLITCHGRRNFPSIGLSRRTLVGIGIAGMVDGVISQTEQEQKTWDLQHIVNAAMAASSSSTSTIMCVRMENTRDQLDTYQPKLAHYLQALTDDDRATFIGQLQKLDFSSLNSAFKRAVEPKLPCAGDIQPIPAQQKVDRAKLGEGETERLTKIGLKAVAEGRVAAVVLAGGQASRLGSAHPKGVLRLGTGLGQNSSSPDSLLFIQAAQIARLQRMARERFPAEANECGGHITWLVMTSGTTDSEIRDHLDAVLKETGLSPAQLLVFTQNEIPAFDFGGQAFLKSPSQLVTAPDGNGGFYDAICPLLPELVKRGVQHLHIYCVDNILCRVADPLMIGCAIDRGADCALKVIEKRDPAELVGHVCRVQELVRVLEYSEITRELAERRCPSDPSKLFLNAGSIANHVVTLNFLREACAKADAVLPYHMARKRIPFWDPKLKKTVQPTEPNGIKLERFIFDAFTLSKDVLLWQVPAEEEFSPLKNPESAGVDCLSTCLRALQEPHAQWIREACIDAQKKELTDRPTRDHV
uniref:UDP-N-acetylglucosamine diphosphorylase n=1 Tax=Globodera pallida TaxID=36090 RepID=A0A183CN45_GLOPA